MTGSLDALAAQLALARPPMLFSRSGSELEKCAYDNVVWKFDPKPTASTYLAWHPNAVEVKDLS